MITLTNASLHNFNHDNNEKEKRRTLSQDELELFRSLFSGVYIPPLPVDTSLFSYDEDSQKKIPLSVQQGEKYSLHPNHENISVPETLVFRATTGPLSGLLLHVSWQGTQLMVKLSTSDKSLSDRLTRNGKKLSEILSSVFGFIVTVEVGNAE